MIEEAVGLREQIQPFFDKINLRDTLGDAEQQALIDAARDRLKLSAGQDLVVEGDRPSRSLLLTSGLACRFRQQADGRRQLMAIHLPGDFVDLHSFLLKEMDHSVGALTDCTIVTFPHERLVTVTEKFPHLTRLLWLSTLIDGAMHREWLVALGLLTATQRTAHLLCEIYVRMGSIGLARDLRFEFPVTQAALSEALGISAVHVNRVIQELRQRGLITWEAGRVTIHNWENLVDAAEFDDRYLHLVKERR